MAQEDRLAKSADQDDPVFALSLAQTKEALRQRDEIKERYNALLESVRFLYERSKWTRENGCGSSSCHFHVRSGQLTNGPCRCFGDGSICGALKSLFAKLDDVE